MRQTVYRRYNQKGNFAAKRRKEMAKKKKEQEGLKKDPRRQQAHRIATASGKWLQWRPLYSTCWAHWSKILLSRLYRITISRKTLYPLVSLVLVSFPKQGRPGKKGIVFRPPKLCNQTFYRFSLRNSYPRGAEDVGRLNGEKGNQASEVNRKYRTKGQI